MGAILGITIAICTWNRSKSLRATLFSLQQLIIPPGIDWELLIVNNNCTDDTDQVIEPFADGLRIRLLHETRQGHSNARNCAVGAAKGDYILWTDDDVIVDPQWLAAYVNAIRTWPNATLFGGPIKLKLEGNPPSWLLELLCNEWLASAYSHRDLSNAPIRLNLKKWIVPYGANLCVRLREQQNFRYNPDLGRCRNGQIRGEEIAVVRAMLESGAEGWWVPDAIVHHVIAEDLQTQAYLRKYFMGLGRTYVLMDPKPKLASFLRALRLLLSAMKWELRFQVSRHREQPTIWFEDLKTASVCWGEVFEFLRASL
jgi:glycosyltransferase involved in cell wall biosynthesis